MHNDTTRKTIAVYDTFAQDYARKIADYAPLPEREKFLQLVRKGNKILDAGCGPGRDSHYFSSQGLRVVGVDLSTKLLEIARKIAPQVEFFKQDLRHLNFPPESFTGIWACASLLHLQRVEILPVLKGFYELLSSNGILFIMVKSGKGEADVKEKLSNNLSRHFTYYEIEELKQLILKAQFHLIDIYFWNEKERNQSLRDLGWISCFSRKDV